MILEKIVFLIFNVPSSIDGDIECVRLKFFHGFHAFLWNVMGGGLIEYQIVKNGNKICSARVVRKIWFFPFMQSNGLHIGPCFTVESERGKGLYPYLLSHIVNDNEGKEFYMIVNENNTFEINTFVDYDEIKKLGGTPLCYRTGKKIKTSDSSRIWSDRRLYLSLCR